jgi:hypothetical protein
LATKWSRSGRVGWRYPYQFSGPFRRLLNDDTRYADARSRYRRLLIALPCLVESGLFRISRKLYGEIGPAF